MDTNQGELPSSAKIPESEIHYDLKGPCSDCPYRKGVPFHAGIFSNIPKVYRALQAGDGLHSCHKTHPVADGFKPGYMGPVQHCGGLLAMMNLDVSLLSGPQVRAIDSGRWDPGGMDAEAPVFASMKAMVRHYIKGAEAELARRKKK